MAKYLYQILLISTLCLFVQNTSAQESTTGFENAGTPQEVTKKKKKTQEILMTSRKKQNKKKSICI